MNETVEILALIITSLCGLCSMCILPLIGLVIGVLILIPMLSWLYYRDYPRLGDKWWLIKDIWKDIRKFVKGEDDE